MRGQAKHARQATPFLGHLAVFSALFFSLEFRQRSNAMDEDRTDTRKPSLFLNKLHRDSSDVLREADGAKASMHRCV